MIVMGLTMETPYFSGETLDDIMRWVFEQILSEGQEIHPTKGPAKELSGVLLELKNPLARLSLTETKGKPFSCLGELLWYLAKTRDLSFISYYLPAYKRFADGNEIFGGYGPRLFNWDGLDQFGNVAAMLKRKPDSRQAVIQLFEAHDIVAPHKDIPCTCTMQFMVRRNRLHLLSYMRSNDAFVGLPHDIFCFTMLQEIMARILGCELGQYKHMVGSLHLYDKSTGNVRRFLGEGWQSTQLLMRPMPEGNPWPAIEQVLSAENAIRSGRRFDSESELKQLDPYWSDLIRLLLIFRFSKAGDVERIRELRGQMFSSVFYPFIDKRIGK